MSSSQREEAKKFTIRFIEICGTKQPTKISSLLGISYQAAKNYLNGRYPDSKTLKKIAKNTPYSIHWLLTGEGEKFVQESKMNSSDLFLDKFKKVAELDFLEAFLVFFKEYESENRHTTTESPKSVILTPDKIREQKVESKEVSDFPINPS